MKSSNRRQRLTVSTLLTVAFVVLITSMVPVKVPFVYERNVAYTQTDFAVITDVEYWPARGYVPMSTITTAFDTQTLNQAWYATGTSTIYTWLLGVAANPSLQPYACTHLNLTGAVFFCIMQFWSVLIVPLIVVVGALVYSLSRRHRN